MSMNQIYAVTRSAFWVKRDRWGGVENRDRLLFLIIEIYMFFYFLILKILKDLPFKIQKENYLTIILGSARLYTQLASRSQAFAFSYKICLINNKNKTN